MKPHKPLVHHLGRLIWEPLFDRFDEQTSGLQWDTVSSGTRGKLQPILWTELTFHLRELLQKMS